MKEIAVIVRTCLNQKINFDPKVDDTGREWWYVSSLYGPMDAAGVVHQEKVIPPESLAELIKGLALKSIKEVSSFKLFDRTVIQIRGNRVDIIKECEQLINQ